MRDGKSKGRKKTTAECVSRVRHLKGTSGFSTAVSCFHLIFPAVSVLVGCKGRCFCVWGAGGVWDMSHLVSGQVFKITDHLFQIISVLLMIKVSDVKRCILLDDISPQLLLLFF